MGETKASQLRDTSARVERRIAARDVETAGRIEHNASEVRARMRAKNARWERDRARIQRDEEEHERMLTQRMMESRGVARQAHGLSASPRRGASATYLDSTVATRLGQVTALSWPNASQVPASLRTSSSAPHVPPLMRWELHPPRATWGPNLMSGNFVLYGPS